MDSIAISGSTKKANSLLGNEDKLSSSPTDQLEQDAILARKLAKEEEEINKDCTNDVALAMMLQKQFDHEHDHYLDRVEAKINGKSKVGVSLDRFKRATYSSPANMASPEVENDSDDIFYGPNSKKETVDADRAWDVFEQCEMNQRSRMMGRSGFVSDPEGNIITKHDIPTTNRRNMCRLMELRTDIRTGDAGASKDDFKIANHVYNKLRVYSKKASRRESQRLFEKKVQDKKSTTQTENEAEE